MSDQRARQEAIRTERNRRNLFARRMGLFVTEMREGFAVARMKITEEMRNPIGSVHGGCIYTVADVACGAAASSYGMQVTTLTSAFNYLRPGLDTCDEIIGTATVIKHGKRVSVIEVEITDQEGTVLSQGVFNYMSLGKPLDFTIAEINP